MKKQVKLLSAVMAMTMLSGVATLNQTAKAEETEPTNVFTMAKGASVRVPDVTNADVTTNDNGLRFMAYLRKNYNYGAMCLTDYVKTNYWPRPVLVRYQELINKAYDAIEYLKYVDMEKYEKTYRDIKVEEFFVTYTTLSLYRMYYSEEGKTEMIDKFEADAAKYRFTNYHESKPMSEAIASWRK
jgi:hypothetical protein